MNIQIFNWNGQAVWMYEAIMYEKNLSFLVIPNLQKFD